MAERRREIALSQDQVAAQSGIDSSNVRAYENGRAMPSLHSLIRIAAALDIDPGVLISGLTPELFGTMAGDQASRNG
jgi:transcriptional regulator with XRE-family HTH domain